MVDQFFSKGRNLEFRTSNVYKVSMFFLIMSTGFWDYCQIVTSKSFTWCYASNNYIALKWYSGILNGQWYEPNNMPQYDIWLLWVYQFTGTAPETVIKRGWESLWFFTLKSQKTVQCSTWQVIETKAVYVGQRPMYEYAAKVKLLSLYSILEKK